MTPLEDVDVKRIVDGVRAQLPACDSWAILDDYGYASLALCTIDAIQSMGVNYGGVRNVVSRYRDARTGLGAAPCLDGANDLIASFADLGGVQPWAASIGNGQRAWSRQAAPLKASVILSAAESFARHDIDDVADLVAARAEPHEWSDLADSWLRLPGQRSGIGWRYLQMLAGIPGVKPDRMVRRFVAACNVRTAGMSADRLAELLTAAAGELGVSATALDHQVWLHQSGRTVEGLTS